MTEEKKQWTLIDLLNTTTDYFSKKNIPDSRLNAERLLAHLLHLDRIHLYLQFDRQIRESEIILYRKLVERRVKHEPLQYILGKTEFMGLTFEVNPSVLIPRPETEILVEKTFLLKSNFTQGKTVIWDIGTGSGCIAIALAKLWPDCRILATDISDEVLSLAMKNAGINQVTEKIDFYRHDILHDKPPSDLQVDIIVSNPPYIGKEEFQDLAKEIREYEPHSALTDHDDGLTFYRRLFSLPRDGFQARYMMLELSGLNQEQIINLAKQFNYKYINTYKDYNDLIRVLEVQL